VRDAKVQLHVDRDAHDHLIDAQEENLEANLRDRTTLHNATASRTAAHNHARTTNSVAANPNFPAVVTTDTRARAAQRQRTNSVTASTTRSQVAQAGVGLVTAQADRATTIVQDQHNLLNAIREAKLARAQVAVAAAADGVVHPGGMVPGLIQQAKGAVADAKAQVGQAQDALDDTVLKAPFKGTILDIAGDVGETPVAAARGNSSPPASPNGPGAVEDRRQATQSGFVTLADLSRRVVTAQIAEKDIRKIQTGQSAQVTFPSTGAVLTGTVNAIEPQETVVDHVVQYNVKVDLDNRAANQMLGQSASVVITTASRTNVLKVPSSAVRSGGPGQGVLTVKRGNDFVKLPVTVGLSGDGETEVASPLLKAGDLVLVPGRRPDGGA
jgi:multidrug efflux pump subunit AcrA (membrane-fusion protein)